MATEPADAPIEQVPGQLPLFDLADQQQADDTFSDQVLRDRLATLIASNRATHRRLIDVHKVMPDPRTILAMRLETLLDLTLTPSQRLRFDVLFETRMDSLLEQCLAQQTRSDLLTGVHPPAGPVGGLIIPPR